MSDNFVCDKKTKKLPEVFSEENIDDLLRKTLDELYAELGKRVTCVETKPKNKTKQSN